MVKYIITYVGKIKLPFLILYQDYLKRLDIKEKVFKREEDLIKYLNNKDYIALSERGNNLTSVEFSNFIKEARKPIIFVIGNENGLPEIIEKNAKFLLSLSKMTFPHDLAKIILLEQLYRAECILKNKKYHR